LADRHSGCLGEDGTGDDEESRQKKHR